MVKIGIIGGGVAGLCAALEASDHGADVSLFEGLSHLGGRAAAGKNWDTGRHLVTNAYHDFFWLLDRLGSVPALNMKPMALGLILQKRIPFWFLNRPLLGNAATLTGLLSSSFLPISKRIPAVFSLLKVLSDNEDEYSDSELTGSLENTFGTISGSSITEYFSKSGWTNTLMQRFGLPMAQGICNLDPEEAAVKPFLMAVSRLMKVKDKKSGWIQGNGENFLSLPGQEILEQNRIALFLKTKVKKIIRSGSKWSIATNDKTEKFDAVIVTIPPSRLGILDDCEQAGLLCKTAGEISSCTIVTVRARFGDAEAMPGPMIEMSENYPIWFVQPSPEGGVLIERVLSGIPESKKPDIQKEKNQFSTLAKKYFYADNLLSRIQVQVYYKATPSIKPGTKRPKLVQAKGLFYAGDWSDTGLPPTLESAARAGRLAGRITAN